MELPYSQNLGRQHANSKIKLKSDKLELTYQYQFLYLCFLLQEIRSRFMET